MARSKEADDRSKILMLRDALNRLMSCFDDEGKLVERFEDHLSIALEESEKAMKATKVSEI